MPAMHAVTCINNNDGCLVKSVVSILIFASCVHMVFVTGGMRIRATSISLPMFGVGIRVFFFTDIGVSAIRR